MVARVTDIPRIMRAQSWTVGAQLMEKWLSLPSSSAPPYTNRDDTIVTMSWALGFTRARTVYDRLLREKIWANEAGRREVRNMLSRRGMLNAMGSCFGVFQSTQPVIHQDAVNYRSVNQNLFTGLDDMSAALANFNFHVQIGGDVAPVNGGHRVTVQFVGVYIRDQYDFIGDQDLGYWNETTNTVTVLWRPGATSMTNETFRNWRAANGRGGDFEVFSDVRITPISPPDVFVV